MRAYKKRLEAIPKITEDSGSILFETRHAVGQLHDWNDGQLWIEVNLGSIELYIIGEFDEPNVNAWQVSEATVWIDRRAAEELSGGWHVAKLNDYADVVPILRAALEYATDHKEEPHGSNP